MPSSHFDCRCGLAPDFCHRRNAQRYCTMPVDRDEIRAAGGLTAAVPEQFDPAERVRQISGELKALTDELISLVGPLRYQADGARDGD